MEQVRRDQAISKSEFHTRLREWLKTSEESQIGPEDAHGRTQWIYIRDATGSLFNLHVDTKLKAVEDYLALVKLHGDDLEWEIALSTKGNPTTVVYGPEKKRLRPFYLYVA